MSIPSEYPDIESYISKVFEFLNEYQWIYDYKNTEILHNGTFDYIPFDLRHTNLDDWPDNFKVFFEQLVDLKQFTVPTSDSVPLKLSEKYPTRGLKVKKLHELLQLGPLIHKVCSSNNIHTIVDIGSGRGYLPQLLYENYGYRVIALESQAERVEKSIFWQSKYFPKSINDVTYRQHFIDKSSLSFLQSLNLIRPVCITGLHCCADLTKDIINLFKQWNVAETLIILPCCYHNLKSFPNSQTLIKLTTNRNLLRIPFLRIACQVGELNWSETLNKHAKNTLNRAVIEFVAKNNNYSLKRIKRLPECTNFTEWSTQVSNLFENIENFDRLISTISEQLEESHREIFKVENLLWIQALLQPLFENIVLLDFIAILNESDIFKIDSNCIKVSNDLISPRCHAIVAKKLTE